MRATATTSAAMPYLFSGDVHGQADPNSLDFYFPYNVLQLRSKAINIKYLEWDSISTRHIAEKGIKYSDIEDAVFHGEWEVRKGRQIKRKGFVIQRYDVVAKAPHGTKYKVILEPVDRKEGLWRCVTAWKVR